MGRLRVIATQGALAGGHAAPRPLAADSPAHAVEDRRMLNPREVRQGARVKVPVAHRDDAGRLDVIAGCEFVDDRIRFDD
jgi:hypothetical protein